MNCARPILAIVCLCLSLPALAQSPKLADGKRRQFSRDIRLTDVLNHRWVDELVTYTLDFPAKQATLNSIRLYDMDHGKELPFQLSEVVFHDERQQFVKSAVIAFFVDELPAEGKRTYTVLWDPGAFASATQPAAALTETDMKAETFEISNGLFGLRLAGKKLFDSAVDAAGVNGPFRGSGGRTACGVLPAVLSPTRSSWDGAASWSNKGRCGSSTACAFSSMATGFTNLN